MDGTSPGNMPVSLGAVWVGTTACNAGPFEYPLTVSPECAGGVTACVIDWPQPQWVNPHAPAIVPYVAPQPMTQVHYHLAQPQPLSDADVERIARRVAEILREGKP